METDIVGATPYISLGMMLGDAHVGVLERCLKSVLNRSSGSLVDEIVLGWNGKDEKGLRAALGKLEYSSTELEGWWKGCAQNPPLKVVPFEWPGRFDTARNIYWKHCRGEWVVWVDGDDEVCDAGTPEGLKAIERVERDYGLPPMPTSVNAPVTLKAWLQNLPPKVNCVYTPYDYMTDENGYVQVRQKMKRIVRRSAGHIWHSPEQSGIHEILTCIGGVAEVMAETFGLLIQHHPSEDEVKRVTRNRAIVEQLTKPGTLSDPRHAYDVANAALTAGNIAMANEAISQAIIHAHNDMDAYTYRLARAFIGMQEGNPEKMLQEAFMAVGLLPEIRDAYFIACDAFYRMGKWLSVIEWFERGVAKTPTLLSRDQPLAVFIAPRAQAALSYAYIGLTEKALKLVEEMEKEYPKSGITIESGQKVRALAHQQGGEVALFNALDYTFAVSPSVAWKMVQALRSVHALDVLRSTVPWGALERRIEDAAVNHGFRLDGGVARFLDNGVINTDDVLDGIRRSNHALQPMTVEIVEERRAAKVVTRSRLNPNASRRIAFYAPTGIYRWECREFETLGMGGSESAVALLARELADLGHEVTTFTNKRSVPITALWRGVIEKDCSQYRPAEWNSDSIVVFCRAPWMAREDPPKSKNVWCWHQDNGYGNPWMWARDTAKRQQHLFVSNFARTSVLGDGGFVPTDSDLPGSAVIGNGILPEFGTPSKTRKLKTVVYASNPSRGLAALLKAWPLVLAQEPEAHLSVACEWNVMLATEQDEPGLSVLAKTQAIQAALDTTPNSTSLGWIPQSKVLELFRSSDVYAYPGGPMPEGFGIALVQAQAAGCKVVAPSEGALPEVLEDKATYWLRSKDPDEIARRILNAMRGGPAGEPRNLERHYWSSVADRFLTAVVSTAAST